MCGVGLSLFSRSRKMIPGSPFSQACFTIRLNTLRAFRVPAGFLSRGLMSRSPRSASTAFMKASVMPTEMLKLFNWRWSALHMMKSMMSGWSTRRIAMLAPRRVPPCLMVSVAMSNTLMKESGPLEMPVVDMTTSLAGRRREKEKPVPPPDLWISAVFLTDSKISSMESPTGSTKQAESWPSSRPAFIRVGELGRNSKAVIMR